VAMAIELSFLIRIVPYIAKGSTLKVDRRRRKNSNM